MSKRTFVAFDWSQLETWLTAFYAGDKVMLGELKAQLAGGHKIHAMNAALIYDIDPADAKTHMVDFQGRKLPAYDGGKRCGHAFNYGMQAEYLAKLYWLSRKFAEEIIGKLGGKYTATVSHRSALADAVYGVFEYTCPRCGYLERERGACPTCSKPRKPVMLAYTGMIEEPQRVLYTPFGRRRLYLGRRKDGANALASQEPQSSGASMWYRTLMRLHGNDFYSDTPWPVVEGARTWSPRVATYGQLYAPFATFVATGTYDSFLIECPVEATDSVVEWGLWTMEQPWPELSNWRIPAEVSVGYNWGEYDSKRPNWNPNGLRDRKRTAFTAKAPDAGWSR